MSTQHIKIDYCKYYIRYKLMYFFIHDMQSLHFQFFRKGQCRFYFVQYNSGQVPTIKIKIYSHKFLYTYTMHNVAYIGPINKCVLRLGNYNTK